jgi:hypothetical protein
MYLKKVSCEDVNWIELALDHVQWRVLILEALNFWILSPESYFN